MSNEESFYDVDLYTYPSQCTYAKGSTMCTSACYILSCSMVGDYGVPFPPTLRQMHSAMLISSDVHQRLIEKSGSMENLFSVCHVLRGIRCPSGIVTTEVMGTTETLPEGFIDSFEDDENERCVIQDLDTSLQSLEPGTAFLLTLNHHTTAVIREKEQGQPYWYFDPIVASLQRFRDVDSLIQHLRDNVIPEAVKEFTGLVITQRKGEGRATSRGTRSSSGSQAPGRCSCP